MVDNFTLCSSDLKRLDCLLFRKEHDHEKLAYSLEGVIKEFCVFEATLFVDKEI